MKTLETGQEKIQKICDIMRRETIEPAQQEAQAIIQEAKERAEEIILEGQKHADKLLATARQVVEQEHSIFRSSLQQSCKQSLEVLRQDIENKLFNKELQCLVEKGSANPQVVANLINCIVRAIDKEGLSTDLSAAIPSALSVTEVNQILAEGILNRLKEQSVCIGDFAGGAQVKLRGGKMTIDITDAALKELVANYVRKDFRALIFSS